MENARKQRTHMKIHIENREKADYRCAIYGPANSFGKPDFEEKMEKIRTVISDLISKGITTFVTSANNGFELSAAVFIKKMKKVNTDIHLVIVKSYPGKNVDWRMAPALKEVEAAADMIKYIADDKGGFIQKDMDEWIISHCNSIIYSYCGQKPKLHRLSGFDLAERTVIYIPEYYEKDHAERKRSNSSKKYAVWAEEYPKHVVILHSGCYYSAWGRSAEVLNEILDYKLAYTKKRWCLSPADRVWI